MIANGGGDHGIQPVEPARGNGGSTLECAGQLPSQRARRIGVPTAIDDPDQAFFESPGVEESVKDRLNRVDNVTGGAAGPRFETKFGMCGDQVIGDSGYHR